MITYNSLRLGDYFQTTGGSVHRIARIHSNTNSHPVETMSGSRLSIGEIDRIVSSEKYLLIKKFARRDADRITA